LIAAEVYSSLKPLEFKDIIEILQRTGLGRSRAELGLRRAGSAL